MTRRGLLSAIPALATAVAQDEPKAAASTREQDLENARTGFRANSEALAKVKVPQATEPAFVFKA